MHPRQQLLSPLSLLLLATKTLRSQLVNRFASFMLLAFVLVPTVTLLYALYREINQKTVTVGMFCCLTMDA